MRPVLVGFLLLVDGFAVASLAIARPGGWLPPFLAFGSLLLGLIWFEGWALRHRHDDSLRPKPNLVERDFSNRNSATDACRGKIASFAVEG